MKQLAFFPIFLLSITLLFSQNTDKITGIIYQKNNSTSKLPVPTGASVFIPGISSTTTDDKGYYSLNLSNCKTCKAGETVRIYVNSDIGYTDMEYVIPSNPAMKPFDIGVTENSKLSLTGIVRDKKTGKLLPGIKVTVVIQNYGIVIPSEVTNENGVFQIVIRKEGISTMQAIQLLFSDADNGKYRDLEKVAFINQYEPIKVELEECGDCGERFKIDVSTHIKSPIKVTIGDLVIIKAGGKIRVGRLVGTSGPEGVATGVFNWSLEDYNHFKDWNHAVLVFRFGEEDEWKFYDDKMENKHIAQHSGFIEFAINDKQQGDNSGAYDVEVIIQK